MEWDTKHTKNNQLRYRNANIVTLLKDSSFIPVFGIYLNHVAQTLLFSMLTLENVLLFILFLLGQSKRFIGLKEKHNFSNKLMIYLLDLLLHVIIPFLPVKGNPLWTIVLICFSVITYCIVLLLLLLLGLFLYSLVKSNGFLDFIPPTFALICKEVSLHTHSFKTTSLPTP